MLKEVVSSPKNSSKLSWEGGLQKLKHNQFFLDTVISEQIHSLFLKVGMQCVLQALEYVFLAPWCLLQVKQTTKSHADKAPNIGMYRRIFYSLFITYTISLVWYMQVKDRLRKKDKYTTFGSNPGYEREIYNLGC